MRTIRLIILTVAMLMLAIVQGAADTDFLTLTERTAPIQFRYESGRWRRDVDPTVPVLFCHSWSDTTDRGLQADGYFETISADGDTVGNWYWEDVDPGVYFIVETTGPDSVFSHPQYLRLGWKAPPDGWVGEDAIQDSAIQSVHLADSLISESHHIKSGVIVNVHVADGVITGAKIAGGAVDSTKIAMGSIPLNRLTTGSRSALTPVFVDTFTVSEQYECPTWGDARAAHYLPGADSTWVAIAQALPIYSSGGSPTPAGHPSAAGYASMLSDVITEVVTDSIRLVFPDTGGVIGTKWFVVTYQLGED